MPPLRDQDVPLTIPIPYVLRPYMEGNIPIIYLFGALNVGKAGIFCI